MTQTFPLIVIWMYCGRSEAEDMCHKFGDDTYIAGEFNDQEDFDNFYQGLWENEKFVKECSFYDNGRVLTWLPYARNRDG